MANIASISNASEMFHMQAVETRPSSCLETVCKLIPLALSIIGGGLCFAFVPGAEGIILGSISVLIGTLISWQFFSDKAICSPISQPGPRHPVGSSNSPVYIHHSPTYPTATRRTVYINPDLPVFTTTPPPHQPGLRHPTATRSHPTHRPPTHHHPTSFSPSPQQQPPPHQIGPRHTPGQQTNYPAQPPVDDSHQRGPRHRVGRHG